VLACAGNVPTIEICAASWLLQKHVPGIREHLEDMPEIMNWQWTKDFSDSAAPAPLAKGHPEKTMFTES
jgi:xylulose-5-phosphate/fructose-6-phosphate phosphoketolase